MASENEPLTGEVLPPLTPHSSLPIEQPLRTVPLFARMRYEAITKEINAYNAAISAATETIVAEARFANEAVAREEAFVRVRNIDQIRETAELKVQAELLEAMQRLHQTTEEKSLNALRGRAERANLEAEALIAEARLANLKNPPPKPPPPPAPPSLAEQIIQLRRQEKRMRDEIIAAVDGEEHLSPEDQEILALLAIRTHDNIAGLIESMGSAS